MWPGMWRIDNQNSKILKIQIYVDKLTSYHGNCFTLNPCMTGFSSRNACFSGSIRENQLSNTIPIHLLSRERLPPHLSTDTRMPYTNYRLKQKGKKTKLLQEVETCRCFACFALPLEDLADVRQPVMFARSWKKLFILAIAGANFIFHLICWCSFC